MAWDGFTTPTWEPAEVLNEVAAIDLFHARRPDKPGPFFGGLAHMEPPLSGGGYCHGPNPHPNLQGLVLDIPEESLASWLAGG